VNATKYPWLQKIKKDNMVGLEIKSNEEVMKLQNEEEYILIAQ